MAGNLNDLHAFRFLADGTAGPFDFVCTRGWLVIDQIASTNTSVAGATVRLQRSTAVAPAVFNNVGDALATDTVDDIEYVAANVNAQTIFQTGDTMRMIVVNLAEADLIVEVLPTSWVAG